MISGGALKSIDRNLSKAYEKYNVTQLMYYEVTNDVHALAREVRAGVAAEGGVDRVVNPAERSEGELA
jgi:hypothetical protein